MWPNGIRDYVSPVHSEEIWVIANLGLGAKFQDQATLVCDALKNEGLNAKTVDSFDLYLHIRGGDLSLLRITEPPIAAIIQVKDVVLIRALESIGVPTFNSSEAVRVCDDKALTHIALSESNVPTPATVVPPERYPGQSVPETFITYAEEVIGYPIIVKAAKGSFGKEVFMAQDRLQLETSLAQLAHRPLILQQFIRSAHSTDLRIQVIDGEVAAVVQRRPSTGDFRANLTLGASGESVSPSDDVLRVAVMASNTVGTLSAGVDLIVDVDGRPLVLEVNSNAHLRRVTEITGVQVARLFAQAITKQIVNLK